MGIENLMYFALGMLLAMLAALIVIPAVWRRAVRLTKKRMEAATPMTMAEFRADKDQLRAEFAISTRRLEMNVESLRRRLADQLRDLSRNRAEIGGIQTERDTHLQVVRELEERDAASRRRVLELEKELADTAQKLRMRERELGDKVTQLESARETTRSNSGHKEFSFAGQPLSGDYNRDVEALLQHHDLEKKRADFLEAQSRSLLQQLESADRRHAETATATAILEATGHTEPVETPPLVVAEASLSDAEQRVTSILAETAMLVDDPTSGTSLPLAERLGINDGMERLRVKVADVESTILSDWDSDRRSESDLRARLSDIATDVTQLSHALDGQAQSDDGQSLYDRVTKFSIPDEEGVAAARVEPGPPAAVSDRLAALRELQETR
jgi:hypothetical protein